MTISVYLNQDVYQILTCYGTLDQVVDRILEAGSQGLIDLMDKPTAPPKNNGTYYHVNIRNQDYISLVESYGLKSSRISIRRLLYWFVDNEIYETFGWETVNDFDDVKSDKKHKVLIDLKQDLFKARTLIPEHRNEIDEFRNLINGIEEELWYAE